MKNLEPLMQRVVAALEAQTAAIDRQSQAILYLAQAQAEANELARQEIDPSNPFGDLSIPSADLGLGASHLAFNQPRKKADGKRKDRG